MDKKSDLKDVTAKAGGWQKEIVTVTQINYSNDFIPHTSAAPMSTDQEAGGAITTPEGDLKYSEKDRIVIKRDKK